MHQELEWIHHLSSAHQHPVAAICMVSLAAASVTASGLVPLTPLWPGFHFPPEAASPTVMGVDKQVDIAAIVAPGATTNLGDGGGERGREILQSSS